MLPPPSGYQTIQYLKSEDHNNIFESNFLAICTWSNVTVFAPRTAGSSDHLQSTCAVHPLEWSWPCTACWQPQTCHQELSQVQYCTFVMESRYGKLTVRSRSAHGPLADRENVLCLYLNACQQTPLYSCSLKGVQNSSNVQLAHRSLKTWQSSVVA